MDKHHQLLSLLFISYVTAGTLYGLNYPTQLVTIDPKTATITNVGTAILGETYSQQLSAIDSHNNLYYFIGLNQTTLSYQLITLALPDGHYISSIDLPCKGETIEVDPNSGILYITGLNPSSSLNDIFRYDPKNGQFTKLNDIGYFSVMAGLNAFDARNNLLWLSYFDIDYSFFLFALDVSSGQWKYQNVSVPMNMVTMTYDSQTGLMYGIGENDQTATRLLVTFNSVSLEFKEVGPIPGYLNNDLNLAAIDVENRKLFVVLEVEVYGPWQLITLDMNTSTVSDHPDVYLFSNFPWSLDFYND